jgi:hypothetical protein
MTRHDLKSGQRAGSMTSFELGRRAITDPQLLKRWWEFERVTRFATFAEAGAVDATAYLYLIEDGDDFELGTGTYTSAGTTFSRDTVHLSKIAGVAGTTKITLSGSAQIAMTFLANTSGAIALGGSVIVSGTAVASTSGTSIDFTGIPSWVKRITVMFSGVSTNGTSNPLIQIGDAGGIENTGYLGAGSFCGASTGASNYTTGFGINSAAAASVIHGALTLSLLDASANTWACAGTFGLSSSAFTMATVGAKSLSATLDRVRITTVAGADTFDAGTINILYE